jgi:hypothetical protein
MHAFHTSFLSARSAHKPGMMMSTFLDLQLQILDSRIRNLSAQVMVKVMTPSSRKHFYEPPVGYMCPLFPLHLKISPHLTHNPGPIIPGFLFMRSSLLRIHTRSPIPSLRLHGTPSRMSSGTPSATAQAQKRAEMSTSSGPVGSRMPTALGLGIETTPNEASGVKLSEEQRVVVGSVLDVSSSTPIAL